MPHEHAIESFTARRDVFRPGRRASGNQHDGNERTRTPENVRALRARYFLPPLASTTAATALYLPPLLPLPLPLPPQPPLLLRRRTAAAAPRHLSLPSSLPLPLQPCAAPWDCHQLESTASHCHRLLHCAPGGRSSSSARRVARDHLNSAVSRFACRGHGVGVRQRSEPPL